MEFKKDEMRENECNLKQAVFQVCFLAHFLFFPLIFCFFRSFSVFKVIYLY